MGEQPSPRTAQSPGQGSASSTPKRKAAGEFSCQVRNCKVTCTGQQGLDQHVVQKHPKSKLALEAKRRLQQPSQSVAQFRGLALFAGLGRRSAADGGQGVAAIDLEGEEDANSQETVPGSLPGGLPSRTGPSSADPAEPSSQATVPGSPPGAAPGRVGEAPGAQGHVERRGVAASVPAIAQAVDSGSDDELLAACRVAEAKLASAPVAPAAGRPGVSSESAVGRPAVRASEPDNAEVDAMLDEEELIAEELAAQQQAQAQIEAKAHAQAEAAHTVAAPAFGGAPGGANTRAFAGTTGFGGVAAFGSSAGFGGTAAPGFGGAAAPGFGGAAAPGFGGAAAPGFGGAAAPGFGGAAAPGFGGTAGRGVSSGAGGAGGGTDFDADVDAMLEEEDLIAEETAQFARAEAQAQFEVQVQAPGPYSSPPASSPSTVTLASGSEASCLKCCNSGHWASSCPCKCGYRCKWPGQPCQAAAGGGGGAGELLFGGSSTLFGGAASAGPPVESDRQGPDCFKCKQSGHWAKDCPCQCGSYRCRYLGGPCQSASSFSGGRGLPPGGVAAAGTAAADAAPAASGPDCFKCGQVGHWARDCPCQCGYRCRYRGGPCQSAVGGSQAAVGGSQAASAYPPPPFLDDGLCTRCGKAGHTRLDCPLADGKAGAGSDRGCFKCGQVGHWASACGLAGGSGGGGAGGSGGCFRCGQSGHWAATCPNR